MFAMICCSDLQTLMRLESVSRLSQLFVWYTRESVGPVLSRRRFIVIDAFISCRTLLDGTVLTILLKEFCDWAELMASTLS